MAQGKVTVNNLNLAQGSFPEIERKCLYIGVCATNVGNVISIDTQTDLDVALGEADSELKANVLAGKQNGGENWLAYAMPLADGYVLEDQVMAAMDVVSPELIAVCTPALDKATLDDVMTLAEQLRTQFARRIIFLTATEGIDAGTQTWATYTAAQAAITADVAAPRVAAVPLLHGNDLGVLAGRLCNRAVSIADSPMRVATGTVLGLGSVPVDSEGVELPSSVLATLDANRLSCIQRYVDYPGTYWGDCNLLDVPAGDYQVIENLRVVDKAARAVRVLAIARVANRSLNSTPISIANNKTYFARPLREMSHSTVVNGEQFPGEIKPPADDAITIVWPTNTKVETYIKVQPYKSPKEIVANIMLDLSNG